MFDSDGNVIVRLSDIQVQQVSLVALRQMSGSGAARLIHELKWQPMRLNPDPVKDRNFLIFPWDAEPERQKSGRRAVHSYPGCRQFRGNR